MGHFHVENTWWPTFSDLVKTLVCIWQKLFLSTYFTIQLIFATIHEFIVFFYTIHGLMVLF